MKRQKQHLILSQIDKKLQPYYLFQNASMPPEGWISTLRNALNMSLRQLGEKMGISAQSVKALERNEKNGTITIKSLREVANALNMQVVYILLPQEGSLESMIENRARQLATEIVKRTSHSMKLEDQENSEERIQQAVEEKTKELKDEMPKFLWDRN